MEINLKNSFLFKAGKKFSKLSIDGNVNYNYKNLAKLQLTCDDLIQTQGRFKFV
jgi:hypothetical protein